MMTSADGLPSATRSQSRILDWVDGLETGDHLSDEKVPSDGSTPSYF